MRRWASLLLLGTAALGLLALAASVDARPGGGQGFSGGGGGGGSGGGGGGGDGLGLIFFLIRLCIEYPALGVPLTIALIVYTSVRKGATDRTGWETGAATVAAPVPLRSPEFEPLRARDPEFSRVLFEDFVYSLYARSQAARHEAEALARLAPYLASGVREQLARQAAGGGPVHAAIVGSLRVLDLRVPQQQTDGRTPGHVRVVLELHANLALADRSEYVRETWTLVRSVTAVTRPWKGLRTFGCPSCGAPLESRSESCASCGRALDSGRFDWMVQRAAVLDRQSVPPMLTGSTEERGTDLPSVAQLGVRERWEALQRDDPGITREALTARVSLVFDELNAAWAARKFEHARPWVSEALLEYLRYWIDAYCARGLVNAVEGARIERWVPVRVERDRHYDALTLRLWGTGRDVTREAASGRVVGGDPGRDRRYSEYWTLIRGAGVRGAPRGDKTCPACGGPLAVSMAGNCDYCGALVTSGDFDWVLSRIEQDDVYAG